jgi:hypothetical protein
MVSSVNDLHTLRSHQRENAAGEGAVRGASYFFRRFWIHVEHDMPGPGELVDSMSLALE